MREIYGEYDCIYNIIQNTRIERMLQGGNAQGNASQYWDQASFSYKFCCLSSTVIFMISVIVPAIAVFCIDIPELTIWSFQIWRLFVSMYGQFPSIMSILSVLFSFMWMHRMIKDQQGSTVYKVIEIVLINLQIHLLFNMISFIFTLLFETQESFLFFGYGWFPIIIVYEFRASIIEPQAERRFCCLPFMIKSKYFPWVILILLSLLSTQFFCFVASGIIGYYQQVVRQDMIIKLPFSVYEKIQSCLPFSIQNRPDFAKISRCEAALKTKCWGSNGPSRSNTNMQGSRVQQSNQQPNSNNYNPFSGSGVKMSDAGNRTPNLDFKNYWAHKQQSNTAKTGANSGNQIEIQPHMHYANQYLHQQNEDDVSTAKLGQNNHPQEALLQQNQNSEEKIKRNKLKDNHSDLI